VYGLSIGDKSTDLNFGLLFLEQIFFHNGYLAHFVSQRDEIGNVGGLANRNLFPEFRELWSEGLVIPCGDASVLHWCTCKTVFFDNFPMFADSFSILAIHCVAR